MGFYIVLLLLFERQEDTGETPFFAFNPGSNVRKIFGYYLSDLVNTTRIWQCEDDGVSRR